MWVALRAELAYSRPWLLGAFGIAVGVVVIVSVVFFAVGDDGPPSHAAAGIRLMFLVMAPLIAGFIIQTYRTEERRVRLLLAGPLTPGQLAGAMVLLPAVLLAMGILAAAGMLFVESLFSGRFELESLQMAGYVGGMIFMMLLMGLLAQEATAAHRQHRRRAAIAGWAGFVGAVLALTVLSLAALYLQGPMTWPSLHLGNFVVALLAAGATCALYTGRTDFTR